MPPRFDRFRFTTAQIDGRQVRLGYQLSGLDGELDLTETLTLPQAPADPHHPAIQRALRDVHIVCGVSYWKSCCPPHIVVDDGPLDDDEAALWQEVYTFGLGEFFYRNDLPPSVRFPGGGPRRVPVPGLPQTDRVLMLIGGGKDSAVAREVLRHAGVDVTVISLGVAPWIRRSAAAMGDEHLIIGRALDRQLFALNDAGAHNGHVPISAIIAAATRLVALIGGYSAVISANERSASEGNVRWQGMEINHQWSKGIRFERLWQGHAGAIVGGPTYFSLLRPLSELGIGACFARHERYFDHVTSCNANFRIRPGSAPARWCRRCPKCVFVYTILAPHLTDTQLDRIFGARLLADRANLPMVRELLGLAAVKPFECVGTPGEVAAALWRLRGRAIAKEACALLPELEDPQALWETERAASSDDAMETAWRERLDAYLGSG